MCGFLICGKALICSLGFLIFQFCLLEAIKGFIAMLNCSFDYLMLDTVLATVTVSEDKVSVVNYAEDKMNLPFGYNENPDIEDLEILFEDRCVPIDRFNIKQLVKDFNQGYDRYSIIRVTHGIMSDDFFWLRFDDEKHLTWNDVKHWKYH